MKEYDIKITEVLEKTVQVQADSREEAEAIASENWNNSLYEMDSAGTMPMCLSMPVRNGTSALRK